MELFSPFLFFSALENKTVLCHSGFITTFIIFRCVCLFRVFFSVLKMFSSPVSYQALFSSAAQLCPTLCNPMNHSMPGLPVHHQLLEFTQTHVHWVGDAIQPSHPLSSPSPPAPNPSQHQGLFKWVNTLHEVAKVLEFQLQHQSFQWTPRTDLLYNGLVGSPWGPRDSPVFSNTTIQKHQFFSVQLSSQSNSHIQTWPLAKP